MSEFEQIEHILEETGIFVGTTAGVSMYPMLRNRKDTVIISRYEGGLKKGDVPLYKRGKQYVLHRVIEVREDCYVIIGDNCSEKEYVKEEQILGILTGFYRGEKQIDMNGRGYQAYIKLWAVLRPIRRCYLKFRRYAGKLYRGIKNGKN